MSADTQANQRIEPMRGSAVRLVSHSGACGALPSWLIRLVSAQNEIYQIDDRRRVRGLRSVRHCADVRDQQNGFRSGSKTRIWFQGWDE